jgi:hypothetical protein
MYCDLNLLGDSQTSRKHLGSAGSFFVNQIFHELESLAFLMVYVMGKHELGSLDSSQYQSLQNERFRMNGLHNTPDAQPFSL